MAFGKCWPEHAGCRHRFCLALPTFKMLRPGCPLEVQGSREAVRARESQPPHNHDRMQCHQAGLTEANPAGNGVLSYCGQIRQITPVPGICTSGPLAAPTNLLSAPAWPKSRTAP